MGQIQSELIQARLKIAQAALRRWLERTPERKESEKQIRREGPGAGDTAEQREKFRLRESLRLTERTIGGIWDPVRFAPSEKAREIARPVARLVTLPGDDVVPEGFATGFLVSPRLLMTNHHVFPSRRSAASSAANFLHEDSERGTNVGVFFPLDPELFYFSDPLLDFALVAVQPKGTRGERLDEFGYIRLIESTGKILKGKPIHIIQHPHGGTRQYAVQNNSLVDILEQGFIHYETDTAPGTSGSPAFNEHWELVGLHHCGIPKIENGKIITNDGGPWNSESESEDDICWLANEGSRVSFIVGALRAAAVPEAERPFLKEVLNLTTDSLQSGQATTAAQLEALPFAQPAMSNNVFNITGTITINLASAPPAAVTPAAAVTAPAIVAAVEVALEKKQMFDPHYASREGYDPNFLGIEIPVPTIAQRKDEVYSVGHYKDFRQSNRLVPKIPDLDAADAAAPLVLHYYYYSLVFNRKYRMAAWTASNADYREEMRSDPRPRKEFGGEDWKPDPRVPIELQLTDADIYGPATNLDRGHLVRREDNSWGAPGDETAFANADTYHWTNCTPQHELFNQERPKGEEYRGRIGIWGAFEGELEKQIRQSGGQMTIFAGPVLDENCPVKDFGKGEVCYPTRFWKIILAPESVAHQSTLQAYGFIFDQSEALNEFGVGFEEALVLTKFQKNKASIATIEGLTGLTFAEVIREADQHKNVG
jgi:endonuclease G, mitochondrial